MIRNWNEGWLFYRGDDAPVPVCLPHDAMLLEPRDAKCRNGVNSGYFPGGKYTYEKHFQVLLRILVNLSLCALTAFIKTAPFQSMQSALATISMGLRRLRWIFHRLFMLEKT